MRDVLDVHTHTIASGHAYSTIDEMAREAAARGMELLGISDHGPAMEGSASRYYFRSSRCIPRTLYGVAIRFGIEFNVIDFKGTVDLQSDYTQPLDYGIASLHDPCLAPGSQKENTHALVCAMDHPKVHIIGHPDDGIFPTDYEELVRQAAAHRVLIELNNVSVRPNSYRINGRENAAVILSLCERYGVQVLISSDAHIACDLMKHEHALSLLEELHFPEELVVNRSSQLFLDALERKNS